MPITAGSGIAGASGDLGPGNVGNEASRDDQDLHFEK